MKLRIIKFEKKYFDEFIELLKGAELPFQDLSPQKMSDFLLLMDGNHLVGGCGLEIYGKNALLRSMVVLPEYQNTGLGGHILAAMENLAREKNIQSIYLLTTTAEKFFIHRNFEVINRAIVPAVLKQSEEFSSICPDTAVCMRKCFTKTGV